MSNVTPLAIFREEDVFPGKNSDSMELQYEDRLTGKVLIFNKKNEVALVGTKVNSFLLLPGGGIEEGESIEDGIVREALEETGYTIVLNKNLGFVEDFRPRDKKHCLTHCYTAVVRGDVNNQKLTSSESENGLYVLWLTLDKAIETLEEEVIQLKKGEVFFYNTGFNILRDHLFLQIAKK